MGGLALLLQLVERGFQVVASDAGALIGVWGLGATFCYSGVVKLRRPTLAAMAIVDFGFGRTVRPVLGMALGGIESILGIGLVASALGVVSFPRLAPLCASVLLLIFAVMIAWNLAAGRRFPCNCFGGSGEDISRWTLLRTSLLALVAVMASLMMSKSELSATTAMAAIVAAGILGSVLLMQTGLNLLLRNRIPYRT